LSITKATHCGVIVLLRASWFPDFRKFYAERQLLIAVFPQLNNSEELDMPVILWLLGVPLSVIVIAALFGAF
jgi:hypothetical protein